jgi:hypothetical protein
VLHCIATQIVSVYVPPLHSVVKRTTLWGRDAGGLWFGGWLYTEYGYHASMKPSACDAFMVRTTGVPGVVTRAPLTRRPFASARGVSLLLVGGAVLVCAIAAGTTPISATAAMTPVANSRVKPCVLPGVRKRSLYRRRRLRHLRRDAKGGEHFARPPLQFLRRLRPCLAEGSSQIRRRTGRLRRSSSTPLRG